MLSRFATHTKIPDMTVLLAVYNGEKYLKEQLNSLLTQTYKDFRILIRDDGSTDNSLNIIKEYISLYSDRITLLEQGGEHGTVNNFAALYREAKDDYIMFCDQDDVWFPDKIEITLNAMKKAEEDNLGMPILVHTDLTVTDENLKVINKSFFKFQALPKGSKTLNKLLIQNSITGCTVMINSALRDIVTEIPSDCTMHDWYLALSASLFGKIVFVDAPTMFYRQHKGNQIGAKSATGLNYIISKLRVLNKVKRTYKACYYQGKLLLKYFDENLSEAQREMLTAFCRMEKASKFYKIRTVNKYGFKKNTLLRRIGQFILM